MRAKISKLLTFDASWCPVAGQRGCEEANVAIERLSRARAGPRPAPMHARASSPKSERPCGPFDLRHAARAAGASWTGPRSNFGARPRISGLHLES
jgi:hypothetical protein